MISRSRPHISPTGEPWWHRVATERRNSPFRYLIGQFSSVELVICAGAAGSVAPQDRKSTRLNSSHVAISYAVFCLKKQDGKLHNGRSAAGRFTSSCVQACE